MAIGAGGGIMAGPMGNPMGDQPVEIGRASCRERV